MSEHICEKCGREIRPNEPRYIAYDSWSFLCNECGEKQILSQPMKNIADLEAKLAKKDEEITQRLVLQEKDYEEEINQLKQQLAEKESELMVFKKRDIDNQKQLERQMNIHKHYLIKKYQDKISFCIEKLEKVKELLWDSINDETPCGDVIGVREEIDNQIEQLKKGMK